MTGRSREIAGVMVPTFLYGTAWKEDRTYGLVREALRAGFRGIDTANQRKHYFEAEVGRAVADEMAGGTLTRQDLFLQTKFTFTSSQDHRLPYDPSAPFAQQVQQSFQSSLAHLGVESIDSYVLHAPSQRMGLGAADLEVWGAMERLQRDGLVRFLGVSNVSAHQLLILIRQADVPPTFVQNRCYAVLGWDAEARMVCERAGAVYQGFSLLTANAPAVQSPLVFAIARSHGRLPSQVVFRFAMQIGMIPLTGTSDPGHMAEDLAAYDFELTDEEVRAIERVAVPGGR
ncbi:MAG TPA: aldo/keto reductase [Actinomycetota bacterium]|nr:aldo/keto reductase [Actinomycetota bacterium]